MIIDPLMMIYYNSYIVVINSNNQNVKFNLKSVSFRYIHETSIISMCLVKAFCHVIFVCLNYNINWRMRSKDAVNRQSTAREKRVIQCMILNKKCVDNKSKKHLVVW